MFAAAFAVARIRALRIAQAQASLTRNVGGAPQGDALFCWPLSQAANDRATTTMLRLAALHLPSSDEGANEAGLARFRGEPRPTPRHRRAGTHPHVCGRVFFARRGKPQARWFFTRGASPKRVVFLREWGKPQARCVRKWLFENRIGAKRTRRERVRQNAYLCVGAAARNRQNQLRPSSPLRPVGTRRMRRVTRTGNRSSRSIAAAF